MKVTTVQAVDNAIISALNEVRVSGHPLTADQRHGMIKMVEWLNEAKKQSYIDRDPPIFRMFGLAGCGKTTMSVAIKLIGFRPLYLSFTNRAVSVLDSKGCTPCRTSHSVMYEVDEFSEEEKLEHAQMKQAYLNAVMAGVPPESRPPLPPSNKRLSFRMRDPEDLRELMAMFDCVVIDECSMIGKRMGRDLLVLGKPIIGVGDPGQLPPVNDAPMFNPKNPEVLLTEVLRTDGDILDMAAHVRKGGLFENYPGTGKDFEVRKKSLPNWWSETDQIICGVHDKRRALNRHVRKLSGFTCYYPEEGEKLCAVANNKELGVYNGSLWNVTSSELDGDYVVMDLVEFAPRKETKDLAAVPGVKVHVACFMQDVKDANEIGISMRPDSVAMTWGYAITCHKAQGSEFDTVMVFDDGHIFREQSRQWRYTAATRAAKKLYIIVRH